MYSEKYWISLPFKNDAEKELSPRKNKTKILTKYLLNISCLEKIFKKYCASFQSSYIFKNSCH